MPNFRAFLDPKSSQNVGLWSLSHKVFTGFTSLLLQKLIASTSNSVWNMGHLVAILGPKISKIRLFGRFSQKVFIGLTRVLFHTLNTNYASHAHCQYF